MKFSLVIPYHLEDTRLLHRLLCSVQSQICFNFAELETIVVANFSFDKERRSADSLCALPFSFVDLNITLVEETKPGPSAARNKGLDIAKGEYILFADCDDVYARNDVFCQFMADVTCEPHVEYISYDFTETVDYPSEHQVPFVPHNNTDLWSFAKIYKREFLEAYNIRFCEDLKVYEDTHFCKLCKALANETPHSTSPPVYYWVNRVGSTIRSGGERQQILNHMYMVKNLIAIYNDVERIKTGYATDEAKLEQLKQDAIKWVVGSALDVWQLAKLSDNMDAYNEVDSYTSYIIPYVGDSISPQWYYDFVKREKPNLFMNDLEYHDVLDGIEIVKDLIF